jgi:hypothetical protein
LFEDLCGICFADFIEHIAGNYDEVIFITQFFGKLIDTALLIQTHGMSAQTPQT